MCWSPKESRGSFRRLYGHSASVRSGAYGSPSGSRFWGITTVPPGAIMLIAHGANSTGHSPQFAMVCVMQKRPFVNGSTRIFFSMPVVGAGPLENSTPESYSRIFTGSLSGS